MSFFLRENVFLSRETAEKIQANFSKNAAAYAGIKENYVPGIIGALLDSVVGGLVILLVARLGFVSMICGFVMGVAVVYGYKKMGKKFSGVSGEWCNRHGFYLNMFMLLVTGLGGAAVTGLFIKMKRNGLKYISLYSEGNYVSIFCRASSDS